MSVLESTFNEEQLTRFHAQSLEELAQEDYKVLREFINTHKTLQNPRLKRLEQTYLGFNHAINNREKRSEELADYRATHDFAKYITDFISGYVGGNPISYTHADETTNERIADFNELNNVEGHDYMMIEDCSIYGRSYELIYRNEDDEDRTVRVSPYNAFMIYDLTLQHDELAGVVYFPMKDADGKEKTKITLYTEKSQLELLEEEGEIKEVEDTPHYYNAIQLIEWENNRFRTCDFEHVLDLFDLYDIAQSDTANYMTDLNDALLKIEGDVDLDSTQAERMKKARIILAKSRRDAQGSTSPVNVDYIYKKYDVAGVEAYKDRIKQDIHMLTYTPNLTDENFSGIQSGEAMKYKMTSLEQVRAKKERMYKKALKKRYRLLSTILKLQNRSEDMKSIKIEFKPNIPQTRKELIDLFNSLGGTLSEFTKLTILDFIENPEEELKRILEERQANVEQASENDEYENEEAEEDDETE